MDLYLALGVLLIVGTLIVVLVTRERNTNPAAKPIPWDAAATVAGVMAAIGGVLLTLSPTLNPEPAPETIRVPVPGPTVTVTPPSPKPAPIAWSTPGNGDLVKNCLQLSGRVEGLAADETVVIGDRKEAEDRWYFETRVSFNPERTRWSMAQQLGSHDDLDKAPYDLVALVMPKDRANYLGQATDNPDASDDEDGTYWSSPDLPVDIRGSSEITVTREFLKPRC